MSRALASGAVLCVALLGSGCSTVGYWAQSLHGHAALLSAARPVHEVLADPAQDERTRAALQRAGKIRAFASAHLALPDNPSYRRYAQIDREAVVWNVSAAPALSLRLHTWCYPIMGCAGYRGYFGREQAQALGRTLQAQGMDVHVYPVPAYSTLGWSNALGGDPLVSTFLHWPEGQLAGLIFHELAHQRVYAGDDTAFNESYATAVEELGVAQWLAAQGDAAALQADARYRAERARFHALALATREALAAVYAQAGSPQAQHDAKAAQLAALREAVAREAPAYRGWAARANNASLGVLAAYHHAVPQFVALFERLGQDWPRFHAEVARIAALPPAQRAAALRGSAPAEGVP